MHIRLRIQSSSERVQLLRSKKAHTLIKTHTSFDTQLACSNKHAHKHAYAYVKKIKIMHTGLRMLQLLRNKSTHTLTQIACNKKHAHQHAYAYVKINYAYPASNVVL